MSGAGSGLAPGAGGVAPPPPVVLPSPPPVQLSPGQLLVPGVAPVGGGPPLVPVVPRRFLRRPAK